MRRVSAWIPTSSMSFSASSTIRPASIGGRPRRYSGVGVRHAHHAGLPGTGPAFEAMKRSSSRLALLRLGIEQGFGLIVSVSTTAHGTRTRHETDWAPASLTGTGEPSIRSSLGLGTGRLFDQGTITLERLSAVRHEGPVADQTSQVCLAQPVMPGDLRRVGS